MSIRKAINGKIASSPAARLKAELDEIYGVRAHRRYGLSQVNQLMHAMQSGALTQAQGCASALVVAAILHDVGHMLHDLGEHPAARGIDDKHELVGTHWLARYFQTSVIEPVRLHMPAKRYLCATERDYFAKLSRDSVQSLALQGGPMSAAEIAAFESMPYWRDAVTLRRIDDEAKDPHGALPAMESFWPMMEEALRVR